MNLQTQRFTTYLLALVILVAAFGPIVRRIVLAE